MAQTTQKEDRAQLLPTKATLTALKSDVTLESAILELCDNSLDAWKRSSNRNDPTTIHIDVEQHDDRTELIIRDNAGGIPREDAAMLFGLGRTAKEQISGSIGTFGVGAKKSLVNLGVPFSISSRTESEKSGWTYRITEEWFEDDEDWTVPVHPKEEMPPGITEIRIEDLNYEWDEETAEGLRRRLGEAYNLFLSNEMQTLHGSEYDLTILVDEEPISPEGIPNWSYSPFDGLHPRRYENIELTSSDFEAPVTMHITVGLLTKKDSRNAGTDIYCQKRKVANCLRDDVGGFGTDKGRLGNFNARHQRLKAIIELETEGDGQMLPWDTQKSTIDKHNPIMRGADECRGVYNWLRRTIQDYFDLDADQVPQAFLEPYDGDHQAAINNGEPVKHDYSDRKRVIADHRPDKELPQVRSVIQKARSHALLRISCTETLEEWMKPAYRSQLSRESDRNLENLWSVSEAPPATVEEETHLIAGHVSELARIHYQNGIYHPDDLEEWQLARYESFMEGHDRQAISEVDKVPPGIPTSIEGLHDGSEETTRLGPNPEPAVHTEQSLEDPSKTTERAELFLVLGGDSDDERGAQLLDVSRNELCKTLDLDNDTADEVLWEEMRQYLETSLDK